jgi:hypothetical protein
MYSINVPHIFINSPIWKMRVNVAREPGLKLLTETFFMNTNTTSLPPTSSKRRPKVSRWLGGILLGFVSLFLMFFLGESFGEPAMYIGVGIFALCAQLFLSRGHVAALRKDWPVILCLNFMLLLSMVLCFTLEHNNPGAHLTALLMAGVGVACSYAGAGLAQRIARNRAPSL